jgi:hypothetical protein
MDNEILKRIEALGDLDELEAKLERIGELLVHVTDKLEELPRARGPRLVV